MSLCIVKLTPAMAAVSSLLNSDKYLSNEAFTSIVQKCADSAGDLTPSVLADIKAKIDDKVLCELMCCCTENPSKGASGSNERQGCVAATLKATDTLLDNKSRYKGEVSYNMTKSPPKPFMHRDNNGVDTLLKSKYWQTRAKQEIPGYRSGKGFVRRPDIIILKDPSNPPYQENIERIVEMKFKNDNLGKGQQKSYEKIAGNTIKVHIMSEGGDCNCDDNEDDGTDILPQFESIPAAKTDKELDWGAAGETLGMGILTGVAAVATIAAVIVPVDGPFGEIAAGTATAAAAARTAKAFARIFRTVPATP